MANNMSSQLLFEYTAGSFHNDEVSPVVQSSEESAAPATSWSIGALLSRNSSSSTGKSSISKSSRARPTRHQIAIDKDGKRIAILKSSTIVTMTTETKKEFMSDLPASAMVEARCREVTWCHRGKYVLILCHSGSIDIFDSECKYVGHLNSKAIAPAGVSVVGAYPCNNVVQDNATWMLDLHCVLSNSTLVSIRTHNSTSGIQYQKLGMSDALSKGADVLGSAIGHPYVVMLSSSGRSAALTVYRHVTPSAESVIAQWTLCSSTSTQLYGQPVSLDINVASACIAILFDTSRVSLYKFDDTYTSCMTTVENERFPSHISYTASNYISALYFMNELHLWSISSTGDIAIADLDTTSMHLSIATIDTVPPSLGPSACSIARESITRVAILRAVDSYTSQVFLMTNITPQRAIERNIRNGNFQAAYDMAQRFGYDMSDVQKGEWKCGVKYGISLDRRLSLLRNVTDRNWALYEIVNYNDDNVAAWRSILTLGLEFTESVVANLIDAHLCLGEWTEAMLVDVEYRHRCVTLLLRLDTYVDLYQSGFTSSEILGDRCSDDLLHWVIHSSLKVVACMVASKGKIETLRRLMGRHRYELFPHWMDILLCIPESIAPDSYSTLFPRNCEVVPVNRYLTCYNEERIFDETPAYAHDASLSIAAYYLMSAPDLANATADACEAYACSISSQYSFEALYRWYIDRAMHYESYGQSLHSFQILCHATSRLSAVDNLEYEDEYKFLCELRTHMYHFAMLMYSNLIHVTTSFRQFYRLPQKDNLTYAIQTIISGKTNVNFIGLCRHYIRPILELEHAVYQEIAPDVFMQLLCRYCDAKYTWNIDTLESDVVNALVDAVVPGNIDILEMICGVAEGSKATIPAAHRCIHSVDLLNSLVVRSCIKYNDIHNGLGIMWRMLECTGKQGCEDNVKILDAIQNVLSAAEVIKDYISIPAMNALLSLAPNYRYNARKVMLELLKGKGEYALGLEKYMTDDPSSATEQYCMHRSKRSKSNEYLRELQFNMRLEHAIVICMCCSHLQTNNMSCWVQLANDIIQLKNFIYHELSLEWCFCVLLQMLLNHQQQLFKQTAQNLISGKLPPQAISYIFHANGITEAHVVDIALRKSREAFNAASSIYDDNVNEAKAYLLFIEHSSLSVSAELVIEWAIHGVLDFLVDVDIDMVPLQLRLLSPVEICRRILETSPTAYKGRNRDAKSLLQQSDDRMSSFLLCAQEYESDKFIALLSSLDDKDPSTILQLHVVVIRAALQAKQFLDAGIHCHRILQIIESESLADTHDYMHVVLTTLHDIIHWDPNDPTNTRIARYLISQYMMVAAETSIASCLDILDLIPKQKQLHDDKELISLARNQLLSLIGDILYRPSDPLRLSQPQLEVEEVISSTSLQNRMSDVVGYLRLVQDKASIDALFAQLLKDLKKKVTSSTNSSRANSSFSYVADEYLVSQIQTMGFSRQGSVRSVLATDNSTMENALRWAIDHSNDADFDDPVVQSSSGLLLKSDLQPAVSLKDLQSAIEMVKHLSSVVHSKEKQGKPTENVSAISRNINKSQLKRDDVPAEITKDVSSASSSVNSSLTPEEPLRIKEPVLETRSITAPLAVDTENNAAKQINQAPAVGITSSPANSVDLSVMQGFSNDNNTLSTVISPSDTPKYAHAIDDTPINRVANELPTLPAHIVEISGEMSATLEVEQSEKMILPEVAVLDADIQESGDKTGEQMDADHERIPRDTSDDDVVIVSHADRCSEDGSDDMPIYGVVPTEIADDHASFIDNIIPENTITPTLANNVAETQPVADVPTFAEKRQSDVGEEESHSSGLIAKEIGIMSDETSEILVSARKISHSSATGDDELVTDKDAEEKLLEPIHAVHFAPDAEIFQDTEDRVSSPHNDSYHELSKATSEVAKLELALHLAIDRLHLPYDEATLARNAILFVEDSTVIQELIQLFRSIIDSASVQNFELLINIIHVLPQHIIDHLHKHEYRLPDFLALPSFTKDDFLKAFESLSLRSHHNKLHDLQWSLAYCMFKSVVHNRKSASAKLWKDVESALMESKLLKELRERPYLELFTGLRGDELLVLDFLKALCMDLMSKYNENHEFDHEIKQLNDDIATYKRIGRVPDSAGINVRTVLQQDDILPSSFFAASPRRAHERVASLLELARFLLPNTVQAWNRALGRVLEIGPSEMGFYCIVNMLCSLQDSLSEDNSAIFAAFLSEITPLLSKIRHNYLRSLFFVIASIPLQYKDMGEDDDSYVDNFPFPLKDAPSSVVNTLLSSVLTALTVDTIKKPKTKSLLGKTDSGGESDCHEELSALVDRLCRFTPLCDSMSGKLKTLYRLGFRDASALTQCLVHALESKDVSKDQFICLCDCITHHITDTCGIMIDRLDLLRQSCHILCEPHSIAPLYCEKVNAFVNSNEVEAFWSDVICSKFLSLSNCTDNVVETLRYRAQVLEKLSPPTLLPSMSALTKCLKINSILFEFFSNMISLPTDSSLDNEFIVPFSVMHRESCLDDILSAAIESVADCDDSTMHVLITLCRMWFDIEVTPQSYISSAHFKSQLDTLMPQEICSRLLYFCVKSSAWCSLVDILLIHEQSLNNISDIYEHIKDLLDGSNSPHHETMLAIAGILFNSGHDVNALIEAARHEILKPLVVLVSMRYLHPSQYMRTPLFSVLAKATVEWMRLRIINENVGNDSQHPLIPNSLLQYINFVNIGVQLPYILSPHFVTKVLYDNKYYAEAAHLFWNASLLPPSMYSNSAALNLVKRYVESEALPTYILLTSEVSCSKQYDDCS